MLGSIAFGQSSSTINYISNIQAGLNVVHTDQLWIGEHADVTVNGDWQIYSSQIYIHPNAKVHGNGRLIIKNPNGAVFSLGDQPTVFDGSHVKIDCDIIFENKNNLLLSTLSTAATDLIWNHDTTSNIDLYVGKNFALNIDDGHVVLGDANLILDDDATISDFSENRYVVTNSEGSLKKEGLQGEFIFPIGFEEGVNESTDYTPARLINNGIMDSYSARVDQEVTDFSTATEGMQREWTIQEDEDGGSYVELTLQHNRNTDGAKFANSDMHFVTQYDGNAPNTLGGSISSTTWGFSRFDCDEETTEGTLTESFNMLGASELTRIGFTDLYHHTKFTKAVCEKTVLADIWKIFTTEVVECETQISWVVFGQYIDAAYFIVERSYDGIDFLPITTIDFTPGNEFYSYFDPIAPNGKVYYRVQVFDEDGEYEYSPVDMIDSKCGIEVAAVYPNPFFEDVTILLNSTDEVDAVILYNEIGQRMDIDIEIDENLIKVKGKMLSAANYYALIIYGDKFYTIELTKLRDF